MNKTFLIFTAVMSMCLMSYSKAGNNGIPQTSAQTVRYSGAIGSLKTANKRPAGVSIKTVASRLDNWAEENDDQSFEYKVAWSEAFMKNTVAPYVAGRYPSKTSLSDIQKCKLLYFDLEKYISNHYEEYRYSSALDEMSNVIIYVQTATIKKRLPDDDSRTAWTSYAAELDDMRVEITGISTDYVALKNGGGSSMIALTGVIMRTICDGMRKMLDQDSYVLNCGSINSTSVDDAMTLYVAKIDYSSLDDDLIEFMPDDAKQNLQDGPRVIRSRADRCILLHKKWVDTLPVDVRSRMVENLSVLIDSAVMAVSDD